VIGGNRIDHADQRGQTFVEYALILVMITGFVLLGWTALTGALQATINAVISAF
jgi:Flp pilus assembly pilin Flp